MQLYEQDLGLRRTTAPGVFEARLKNGTVEAWPFIFLRRFIPEARSKLPFLDVPMTTLHTHTCTFYSSVLLAAFHPFILLSVLMNRRFILSGF